MKLGRINLEGKIHLIPISDELFTKYRIMEELASMALETEPIMNCKDELKEVPIIYWEQSDLRNDENDDINKILLTKEAEFQNEFQDAIVKELGLKLIKNQNIFFGDAYKVKDSDSFVLDYEIELEHNFDRKHYFQDQLNAIKNGY